MSWPVDEFATGWPRAAWPGSLADQVRVQLQRRGDSLLIPGVGVVDGFNAGTYSDSAGATPAVLDDFLGRWVDSGAGGLVWTQAATANKPQLTKQRNLLTKTNDLGASPWTSVQGVSTYVGNKIIPAATTFIHGRRYAYPQVTGRQITISAWVKAAESGVNLELWTYVLNGAVVNLTAWTVTSVSGCTVTLGDFDSDGYRKVSYTLTEAATGINNTDFRVTRSTLRDQPFAGDGASGYYLKNPQIEVGPVATRSQQVNTITDYDAEGFPYLVRFDSTDTMAATIPAGQGYDDCTIIDAAPGGQVTQTGQNIVGTHTIGPSITTHGRIIVKNGATLTAPELAVYQQLANKLAGL